MRAAIIPPVTRTLLGGLSAAEFLRRHWQKRPLLVRGATGHLEGLIDLRQLIRLSGRQDCESRLVIRERNRWHVKHGPFPPRVFRQLPDRGWTLLVQGVERFLPAARSLLELFSFVPHARLDDLMVSYAPPGGGVGPHFDSYDVFLLQARGHRRWRVSTQRDLELVPDAPLKILRRFRAEGECTLAPGDMLYLPPRLAHDGIALDDCFTCSIGFRAPTHRELATEFLAYLEDRLAFTGIYADPGLKPQRHAARLPSRMILQAAQVLDGIRWGHADVVDFLGRYLTEPKPAVTFDPSPPCGSAAFSRDVRQGGLELAPGSRMLFHGRALFLNGESFRIPGAQQALFAELADRRRLSATRARWAGESMRLLYRWYLDGYILLRGQSTKARR
jgi:50S ribosomal protein L16 3-hydroxylase